MSAQPLNDQQIKVNVSDDLLTKSTQVATSLKTKPAGLARVLLEQYVEAYKKHGGNMPWPPRFQYYDAEPVNKALEYSIRPRHLMIAEDDDQEGG